MGDTEPYKAEFEAWARVECNLPFYAAIDWNQAWTKQAWKIWQASALASRPAEVDDEIRKQGDTMAKWLRSMSVIKLPFDSWAETCYELSSKWTELTGPSNATNKEK